ncbi:MAG: hypothetical protein ACOYOA_00095 [Saprospiraceae bacterium]
MKKIMLMLSFFAFISIINVSAQSCASKKSCCAKKTETSSTSTSAVSSDDVVKKVANTSEAKACCAKGDKKSCSKKEASSCHGAGKMSDATVPSDAMQIKTVKATEEMKAPVENQN